MPSTFLERAMKRLTFGPNRQQDNTGIHPDHTLRGVIRPDAVEAVQAFRDLLNHDDEPDVGDWKRDMNAALIRLKEDLLGQDFWVIRTVEHMQSLLNWSWREDVENLRLELNKRANGILKGLKKDAFRERMGQRLG